MCSGSPVVAMGSVHWAGGQAERPVRLDFPFLGNLLWHGPSFSSLFDFLLEYEVTMFFLFMQL
jgi:hypothetical protein